MTGCIKSDQISSFMVHTIVMKERNIMDVMGELKVVMKERNLGRVFMVHTNK